MKKTVLTLVAALAILSFAVTASFATPAKAKATGKSCKECHNDQTVKPGGPKANR